MKTMYTVEEFLAEINRTKQAAVDYVETTDTLRVETSDTGTTRLERGRGDDFESFPINDVAHQQIAARLGIPKPYYDRMRTQRPELLDQNINNWLHDPVERRLIRTLDGKVRAFLSDRYQRIDNWAVLEAVQQPLGRLVMEYDARIESSAITDTKMYLKVVIPTMQTEIRRGDIVQAGFVLKNSETGHGAYSLEQMLFRLVCLNGMTVGESISRRHVGARIADGDVFSDRTRRLDDQTLLSATRDLIEAAVDETRFQALAARMGETANTAPTPDPVGTVGRLAKAQGLSEQEQGLVLSNFVSNAARDGLTLFGLLNAVTQASQNVESYERATELEELGGKMLDTSSRDWLALSGVVSA